MGLLKKNKFKGVNLLDLTPSRNYEHEETSDGLINVLVPKFRDKVLGNLLQPRLKDKYIRANMDKFGSMTWLLIDGKTSIHEICKILQEEYGEDVEPVYDRVSIFISNLYKNQFINFNEFSEGKNYG